MKKIMMIFLTGSLAIALTACGQDAPVIPESEGQVSQSPETPESRGTSSTGSMNTDAQLWFEDSVFFGDSITEGLSYHDVLKEEIVLAGAGKTSEFALKDVEELAKRNPKRIYIQLGSDDILWPTDDPIAYSMNNYAKLIEDMKQQLPQARITLLSVTPVTEAAEDKEPRYSRIADYNHSLKQLAERENVHFIDISPIFADSPDLYDTDGIHFKPEYYPILLEFLKDQVE
ncbi:GDSL-type esterase/lipase family protein [Paenibacillus campinasensis]|uniref:Lysophospholipase n=1 Tax=Paenibacillus campinasensis TaxID=66347 RepID=A0A268ETQ3_9BACL|nr:GDSL-type esterase/lipase family protein [Paenibacillus campinasensis]PAD76454.1 lysophospholipase [Paenibacillus campinasensis]